MKTEISTRRVGLVRCESLMRSANAAHRAAVASAEKAIRHAVRAGRFLMKAREHCAVGEWEDYVKSNFQGSLRTAQKYMRIAKHWPRLIAERGAAQLTSQNEAVQALKAMFADQARSPRRTPVRLDTAIRARVAEAAIGMLREASQDVVSMGADEPLFRAVSAMLAEKADELEGMLGHGDEQKAAGNADVQEGACDE